MEHARHFVTKVESIITIMQWKEFEKLTNDCKTWVKDEVAETQKQLNFILSEEQKQLIQKDTKQLQDQLGKLIDEYSIVKQSSNGLAIRDDFEDIIDQQIPTGYDAINEHEMQEDLQLQQKPNGWDFEEEIGVAEEVESWTGLLGVSYENYFLGIMFMIIILLGLFLYLTRKRQQARPMDSQVSKYKSLSASYGPNQSGV